MNLILNYIRIIFILSFLEFNFFHKNFICLLKIQTIFKYPFLFASNITVHVLNGIYYSKRKTGVCDVRHEDKYKNFMDQKKKWKINMNNKESEQMS